MTLFLLTFGLIGLWVGAELIVKGALDIANHYKLSQGFIGLTILALGTDLPELFVNGAGAIEKNHGLATSDLIISQMFGTGISQITLILGIAGLVDAVSISKKGLKRDIAMLVASVAMVGVLALDGFLSKTDGIVLMLIYGLYFISVVHTEKVFDKFMGLRPKLDLVWSVLSLAGGFIVLAYASDLVVVNGIALSTEFGISALLVGPFLIGLGTSLPELATAITALKNKAPGMATGNILGSNIFDMLFAMGLGVSIASFSVSPRILIIDFPLLLGVSIIVGYLFTSKNRIDKKEAIGLIGIYLIYLVIKLMTETNILV